MAVLKALTVVYLGIQSGSSFHKCGPATAKVLFHIFLCHWLDQEALNSRAEGTSWLIWLEEDRQVH